MAYEFLVEAESFDDFGGWVLDSQFELEMGSPYLLAHGNGTPVADATTTVTVSEPGNYHLWVRVKDWVPEYHPGRFNIIINGHVVDTVFGENGKDWNWQSGGQIELPSGPAELALRDLTGFCGRCDALFFSTRDTPPPATFDEAQSSWRKRLRGLPNEPVDAGNFDVIVVGGGVPGIAAALTSARLGERVALVHDRPFLGGNASPEIGLRPRGKVGRLVDEIYDRHENGDLVALQLLQAEPNATVFTEHTVYAATTSKDRRIISILARDARSGREIRLSAFSFIDCSGKAILGVYAGAETLSGRESRDEYGESLAPLQGDKAHHGNTVFFRTKMLESPVHFPAVPWATDVSKEFSNLSGQLVKYGEENGPGPHIENGVVDPTARPRMKKSMTHYWEFGQFLDPYTQAEHIRDHLLRAIYGTFSNVKRLEPEKYANLALDWVAFVPAQGEFLRYKGDYVLTENDIRNHEKFPDAVVQNEGAFCLHIPGNKDYDFRLKDWEWDERDGKPYDIPFRCLYSTNVSNLMMAGKHISTTHVASSNTKFMGNGGQHAIAVAAAARLCRKYKTTPRDISEKHIDEMRDLINRISEDDFPVRSSHL
ncbi:FAD dependent oxidoreductase domain-containing protein [Trichoderma chlorosporum]